MHDESIRAGPTAVPDPGNPVASAITDSDIAALKAKFPFLREFSNGFIKANKQDCLNAHGNHQHEAQRGGTG
jgi:hypothetical protein